MFPYDTKVYGIVNSQEDQKRLQDDIKSKVAWSKTCVSPMQSQNVAHVQTQNKARGNSVPFDQNDLKTNAMNEFYFEQFWYRCVNFDDKVLFLVRK